MLGSFLKRLGLNHQLSSQDVKLLQSLPWAASQVKRGQDILRIGDRPGFVYIIERGWAGRYGIRVDGSRRITGFMLPGDFCGIHAVTEEPIDHSITALADCDVARIQNTEIRRAVAASPAIGAAIWRVKLQDEATLRMWLLNSQDSIHSLAHLICEIHLRSDVIAEVQDGRLYVPMTQEQLGDALGITSVHTNRILKQLRTYGLIENYTNYIRVIDIDALRAFCKFLPQYLHFPTRDEQSGIQRRAAPWAHQNSTGS